MQNSEIDIFEIIKKNYEINDSEILCAAYIHTPSSSPENYLMLNSFAKKDFSNFTENDSRYFIKSSFSALDEKEGFLRFLNHNIKISKTISSRFINIREEKYNYKDWVGSLFFISKQDVIGKIGIELFYEKNVINIFNNPILNKKNTNFNIIDIGPELSKQEKLFRLFLNNKYIVI